MTDRELMQQALKALETCKVYGEGNDEWVGFSEERVGAAVTALRERLAQPQRTHWEGCEEVHPECKKPETVMAEYKFQTYAAYKTPDGEMKIGVVPDDAPRREWVGLTDEEKLHLEIMGGKSDVMLAEAIEAKLKEKNA